MTDNGSECCSSKFDTFYKENDIKRYNITPYTLQRNGIEK